MKGCGDEALSIETSVELYKGGILPLEQFAVMAYDRDILVRLIVKKRPGIFAYRAFRNQRTDLPVIPARCPGWRESTVPWWEPGREGLL